MATFSQPTIESGSDMVQDFLCSTCEEKKLEESADYYCESCVKFFCTKCIDMHSQLFSQHSPHGSGDMKKWPVAKKVEDFLLKCDVHAEENIDMFCEDHSQLCCNKCAFLNHRTCKTVMLLSDLLKNTSTDLKQVSVTIQTTLAELKKLQDNQEASIQSLQSSYDEQVHKIQETPKKILAALKKLENKALNEMKDTLTKLQAPLKSDINKCATLRGELKKLGDSIQDINDKSQHKLSLIASIKCQDKIKQFENYQKENFVDIKSSITFEPNSEILQYLSKLSDLGRIEHSAKTLTVPGKADQVIRKTPTVPGNADQVIRKTSTVPGNADQVIRKTPTVPGNDDQVIRKTSTVPGNADQVIRKTPTVPGNADQVIRKTPTVPGNDDQVIRMEGKAEYDVRQHGELSSNIRDICFLPGGQILVIDTTNKSVKVLNQQYQVVFSGGLSDQPLGLCQIKPNEVGVTVGSEIHFITVNNSKLVGNRKINCKHACRGIAYREGDLFVLSGTALYKYRLSGEQVGKLYEVKSDCIALSRCAVSPTGDKLYITNHAHHKLLTLARDGSVLATFMDPELMAPTGVHVTPAGQVLVCGSESHTIIQMDKKGCRKLSTLASKRDGIKEPAFVFYNSNTGTIIVGQFQNKKILVFKVK